MGFSRRTTDMIFNLSIGLLHCDIVPGCTTGFDKNDIAACVALDVGCFFVTQADNQTKDVKLNVFSTNAEDEV